MGGWVDGKAVLRTDYRSQQMKSKPKTILIMLVKNQVFCLKLSLKVVMPVLLLLRTHFALNT